MTLLSHVSNTSELLCLNSCLLSSNKLTPKLNTCPSVTMLPGQLVKSLSNLVSGTWPEKKVRVDPLTIMILFTGSLGSEIQPYVEPMLQRLFPLIVNPSIQRTLLENVAITIGRLGLICPTMVAPHLENFVHPWLVSLTPVRDNDEKASAFSGLCEIIKANPQGAVKVKLISSHYRSVN